MEEELWSENQEERVQRYRCEVKVYESVYMLRGRKKREEREETPSN